MRRVPPPPKSPQGAKVGIGSTALGFVIVTLVVLRSDRYPEWVLAGSLSLLALQLAWYSFWLGRLPRSDAVRESSSTDDVWKSPST